MKNEIKKQMLIRGFGAMPTGIAVGFLIPLVISIVRGSGQYIALPTRRAAAPAGRG